MFNSLSSRFKDVFNFIGKKASIEEKDLDGVLREIRLVLLEADVSLEVIRDLIPKIKADLLGKEIYRSISPKQVILKSVYDHLYALLDFPAEELQLYTNPTTFTMMVGLQGTGKTTTAAKIAYNLKNKQNKKVLLVGLDLNRPAAYEQLQTLAKDNGLDFFEYTEKNLKKIIADAKTFATKNFYDVVILDTAGRLSIDEELMSEMQSVYELTRTREVLLVMDSMAGQISFDVAKKFSERVPLSGLVVSKADADSRGGAILSAKFITQVPIKFMGVGEKIADLEAFIPKRIVDRVLDQGDIISLIENFEEIQDEEDAKMEEKLLKGQFSMDDLKKQLLSMKKMGGAGSIMSMIPGLSSLTDKIKNGVDESVFKKHVAIIDSMTPRERQKPDILNFSRKKRIAAGSGTTLQDINVLLKQFEGMSKMFKKFKGVKNPMELFKGLGINPNSFKK
ncbi:MAG: signal recognition particle protein [Alphaproteobacteria bacterium]|jgi:signal recognition particle subunit SRP54|nr:signal recognition particle protein [Alphaproteobacteria bacterium]